MPPFAAACPRTEEAHSVQNDETRLQEAQLSDWLAQGEAFAWKTLHATEAVVVLKVFSKAQPESVQCLEAPCTLSDSALVQADIMQVCYTHPDLASVMLKNPGEHEYAIPVIELLCHTCVIPVSASRETSSILCSIQ